MTAPFTYADLDTGEMHETTDPVAFWMHLRSKASVEVHDWLHHRREAITARIALAQNKEAREYIHSEILTSGAIDGSNAEMRKAQQEQAWQGHEQYAGLYNAIQDAEERIAVAEAEAEAAHSMFRVTLRDLEIIAALYAPQETAAAEEGR